ncbi:acyl carrier protein [Flavihumibacter petaseus]|uniref:Acyl carrier protein n=1 Tax=Flavihumibacter petaseus NBRC 106054 TaxID=1220578 RepID=A0A0E9MWY0_9BACT|nr:phosphopantetheine-binding protein [Flavihumibacter petaseus]GAO42094.1 acyl carrier protein [Flavihumibacter petaseus NBRC 106054]
MATELIEKINHFLATEFEVDVNDITAEGNMKEVLDLDSLDYIDMVVVIENNFGFKVKPEDFTEIITFQDFYDYVAQRINTKELV